MDSFVEIVRINDSRFAEAEKNIRGRAYDIAIGGIPFGFFYVTKANYTIAWDGHLDFGKLDFEVFEHLGKDLAAVDEESLDIHALRDADGIKNIT